MATEQLTLDQAEEIINTYMPPKESGLKPIPHLFIKDILGCNTWHMQDVIVQSVFQYKTTAVKTCNAVGKSYIAARIVVTYLTLLPGSVVVTTAPTWRQVTDVLWREIATAVKMAKYQLTKNEVRQAGLDIDKDWFAVGLSTKYPENFFGYHADNILVVVDEAGGVPEPIFRGVKAITPNANARVLYIGNPTTAGGTFHQSFSNPNINCITISAFDTPNFTENGIHTLEDLLELFTPPEGVSQIDHTNAVNETLKMPFPALIDPAVVYERYHEWGVDSPAWESLIMGEFPSQADQALIPADLVKQAMMNYGIDTETGKTFAELSGWAIKDGEQEYGLDMARFGSDRTVFTPRHGGYIEQQVVWAKVDLMESAQRVLKLIDPYKKIYIKIDDTGNGGGTTDRLNEIKRDRFKAGQAPYQYQMIAYNFSSKEEMVEPDKFHDITSEIYWALRQMFLERSLAIPWDQELHDELVARRWQIMPGGKIKVESKEDYRKRTAGRSPDKSDSLALSIARGRSGSWITQAVEQKTEPRRDEDPLPARQAETRTFTGGLNQRH